MAGFRILWGVALIVLLGACGGGGGGGGGTTPPLPVNTTPKGLRVLGLDIANPAENNDFNNNLALARAAGIETVTLHLDWNAVEPGLPDVNGNPVYDASWLALISAANTTYRTNNLKLSLTLAPIDTTGFKVPSDLTNQAFYDFTSDPSGTCLGIQPVLTRFNQMVDAVLARLPDVTLTSLQIGNEIDIELLQNHAAPLDTLWSQYAVFVRCVRAHVRTRQATLPVGMTFTYGALTGAVGNDFKEYNRTAQADVIGVTYYPLNADFTVKSPLPVAGDFRALVNLYHNQSPVLAKPIYVQEVGLPTSSVNGSSEAQQQQFVRDVFAAWDTHASAIPFLAFLRLHDLGTPVSATDKYTEYLRTLGLRRYSGSGTSKPGYCALKSEARARGWSADNAACP